MPIKEVEGREVRYERIFGDVSKWFGENDTIEFDDSAEAFMNITHNSTILETLKIIRLKIYRDNKEIDIKKESFHCVAMINKCIMSFFAMG